MPKIEVSCTGVEALIGGLDDSKATCPDNIGGKLLKLAPAEVSQCLTIIYSYLETFQIITEKQHGFRKKYSCTSQLLMLGSTSPWEVQCKMVKTISL